MCDKFAYKQLFGPNPELFFLLATPEICILLYCLRACLSSPQALRQKTCFCTYIFCTYGQLFLLCFQLSFFEMTVVMFFSSSKTHVSTCKNRCVLYPCKFKISQCYMYYSILRYCEQKFSKPNCYVFSMKIHVYIESKKAHKTHSAPAQFALLPVLSKISTLCTPWLLSASVYFLWQFCNFNEYGE